MIDIEKFLLVCALIKWANNENMSAQDLDRIINMFDKIPLNLEIVDNARAAGLQVKLRSILHDRFLPKAQP